MDKNIKSILTNYKIYIGIIIVLLVIIAVLLFGGGDEKEPVSQDPVTEGAEDPDMEAGEGQPDQQPEEPANSLEENSHASIDRLVGKYCESIAAGDVDALAEIVDVLSDEEREKIQNRATFIESFDNVTCYTKDGPVEDSFIVFVCYDMKLINIETKAPDIICLYVGPKGEEGSRRIHYGSIDASMQEYVTQLEQDPEVQALYDDVSRRYQEAQEQDETLAAFVQKITGQVAEAGPEEEVPEETPEEEPEAEPEEEPEAEPEEPEEPASPEATAQNRQTRTNDTVNVRSEPSTESSRIALAYAGASITQIESYDNGWSKVEYEGQTGYVMTEYLE